MKSLISIIVGFYTGFVVQTLWNWFVATYFNLPPVPYWSVFVFIQILGLLKNEDPFSEGHRSGRVMTMLDGCIRPEKREEVQEKLEHLNSAHASDDTHRIVGQIAANTIHLALGWAIHTFLVP